MNIPRLLRPFVFAVVIVLFAAQQGTAQTGPLEVVAKAKWPKDLEEPYNILSIPGNKGIITFTLVKRTFGKDEWMLAKFDNNLKHKWSKAIYNQKNTKDQFLGVHIMGDKIYVFVSESRQGRGVYQYIYDYSGNAIKTHDKILDFGDKVDGYDASIELSPDKKSVGIFVFDEENSTLHYVTLNGESQDMNRGNIPFRKVLVKSKFPAKEGNLYYAVNNDGNLFVAWHLFKDKKVEAPKDAKYVISYMDFKDKGLIVKEFPLKDEIVSAFDMQIDDRGNLQVAGLWSRKNRALTRGVFNFMVTPGKVKFRNVNIYDINERLKQNKQPLDFFKNNKKEYGNINDAFRITLSESGGLYLTFEYKFSRHIQQNSLSYMRYTFANLFVTYVSENGNIKPLEEVVKMTSVNAGKNMYFINYFNYEHDGKLVFLQYTKPKSSDKDLNVYRFTVNKNLEQNVSKPFFKKFKNKYYPAYFDKLDDEYGVYVYSKKRGKKKFEIFKFKL